MAKKTKLTLWCIVFSVVGVKFGLCQTAYYVDPAYTGGGNNGSAAQPWTDVNNGWTAINSSLASGPVTVYFSATQSSSPITITRTNASTNVLTLDGISQKNTNETSGSWTASSNPVPCAPQTGESGQSTTCVWYTAPKFTITGTIPIASNGGASSCIGYVTVQGFKLDRTEGQIANLTYIHDLTFQYNEAYATKGGSYGPGVYVGPANNGPCVSGGGFSGPANVTVQYNYIHDTYEDCIYDGASTPDPPGYGGSEYSSLGLTCTTACDTGQNHVIQYNIIGPCSNAGGTENVGINVKDGHLNHKVVGNIIRPTYGGTFSSSAVGPGINLESCGLVDGNYVEAAATVAIAPQLGWNNSNGRQLCTIRNNIVVNNNSGTGRNAGLEAFGPNSGANQIWQGFNIYNNTIYDVGMLSGDPCITVDGGSTPSGVVNLENNIVDTCGSGGISVSSGQVATRDYNVYSNAGTCPASGEGSHGLCSDPSFMSTSSPYQDANFKLQSSSPAMSAGVDLAASFTDDYFGAVRTVPWNMGAISGGSATSAPTPPSALSATVN